MISPAALTTRLAAFALATLAGASALAPYAPAAGAPGQDEDEGFLQVGAPTAADLARDAFAVLQARCVSCHRPDAEDRKAVRSWPDALDVPAMIEDLVIELDAPAQSYLLELIDDGEMPPADSDVEPVTEAERATLLAWIAAGAPNWPEASPQEPPPRDGDAGPDGSAQEAALPDEPPEPAPRAHVFVWSDLGVLHPLIVHFPIGLLLAAVLAELLVACGARGLRTASRFCAWLGFLGGVAAGATGWLQAEVKIDRSGLMETHRWLGVASVVTSFFLALSLEGRTRGGGSRALHVTLVLATAVLVSLAAHWGGALTWGTDLFSNLTFLPAFLR